MPTKTPLAFQPKSFTISGKGFEICMRDFPLKPTGKRKRGYGEQYSYTINDRETFNQFRNHFDNKAADFADEYGDDHPTYLQLVKDAGNF